MPRILGSLHESTRLNERVDLMHLVLQEKDVLRSRDFLSRSLDTNHRTIVQINSFAINEKVWFHHHLHGWRTGPVASINLPTIMVEHNGKLYTINNTRIRPYFGGLSVTPALEGDQLIYDRFPPQSSTVTTRTVTISDLLNSMTFSTHLPMTNFFAL